MRDPVLGETVAHLAWLSPSAASLVALARSPVAEAWPVVRTDPGAVLLIAREASATRPLPFFSPALLHDPAILDGALRHLDPLHPTTGRLHGEHSTVHIVYQWGLRCALLAQRLAERTGLCDAECAWVAGLLAPLGWFAICAADPAAAAACREDPAHAAHPAETERRHWGLDQAGIARRLARRWHLPGWLAAAVGHLSLPVELAQTLGADPALFRIVQLAVGLAQTPGPSLHLAVGAPPAELGETLGVPPADVEHVAREELPPALAGLLAPGAGPDQTPLLRDLLALAAENRRLRVAPVLQRLERDVDDLHRALEEQRQGEAERLQTLKLNALAEFAAGAGHEINNPLAVLSGQAQYLLQHEEDGSTRATALQTIVQQGQRIHQTLRDLRQFARPPRPQKQRLDLNACLREAVASLADLAATRRVRLVGPEPGPSLDLCADPGQVRTMVACLLRNAIEAAPADGWASLSVVSGARAEQVEVVVEDSGPGVPAAHQEHLFDPFYSGRQAGRGRGLGLPTAWRLARGHGGDVRFVPQTGGPTRFVLILPRPNGPWSVVADVPDEPGSPRGSTPDGGERLTAPLAPQSLPAC